MRLFSLILLILLTSPAYAVQGGQEVDPREALSQSVISLGDGSSGALNRSYCSGVIVSDHTIITAAHCLYGKNPAQVVVEFGTNGNETTVMRLGTAIHIPNEYQTYGANLPDTLDHYDIGVLNFSGGLPAGFKAAELMSEELNQSSVGSAYFTAGFGKPQTGVLTKCQVTLLNADYARSEFELSASPTCSPATGDSGGPVYRMNGSSVQVYGLHNWGWHDQNGNPNMSVEVKISFYYPWINSF